MIVSALTGDPDITPATMLDWALDNKLMQYNKKSGYSGRHGIPVQAAKDWDLRIEKVNPRSVVEMSKRLREGKFLFGIIRGGGSLYKGGGHFIGFSGITGDGLFYILDSGYRSNMESSPHPPETFIPYLDKNSWYALWKE
jgi:hypothetical protein